MTPPRYPESWKQADADLRERLARLDAAVREQAGTLRRGIEAEVTEPLQALVDEAAAAHRHLMEQHGFDRAPGADLHRPGEVWEALVAYRRSATAVHERLRDGLSALDLGAAVGSHFKEAFAALPALAENAPREVMRPEPAGLVEAEPGDRTGLRARKAAERTRRRIEAGRRAVSSGARALVRKGPVEPEPRAQTVPLRRLLEEHASVRVAGLLAAQHERTQQALGQAVAHLEETLEGWAETLLLAESALNRPRLGVASGTPPPNAPEGPELTDPAPEVHRLHASAQTLDRALRSASFAPPSPDEAALSAAHEALEQRVRRSGYDAAVRHEEARVASFPADAERWAAWHRHLVERLDVDVILLGLREQFDQEIERFLSAMTKAVAEPVRAALRAASAELERLRAEAAAACDRARIEDNAAGLAASLREMLREVLVHVDRSLLAALQPISLDRTVEDAVGAMRARFAEAAETVPERLTLHTRLAPERAGQLGTSTEIGLRALVRTLLGEEFAARLVKNADPLRQPLFRSISDAESVRDVARYNLEAAIEDLEAATRSDDDGASEAIANARELTVDGLARSIERLQAVAAPLDEPWQAFVRRTADTFEKGWAGLHQRVNAQGLAEAQLLDLKTRVARAADQSRAALRHLGERGGRVLHQGFRFGRREAHRLVQISQAATGLAGQSLANRQRTLDVLADSAGLHAALPLVYRRLFSFAPIADPGLFVGRKGQVARVTAQFERWRKGLDSSALVVTAAAGVGRTSFVQTLQATAFADADVAMLSLSERVVSEEEFAARLGGVLGVPADAARSLDRLEAHLLATTTQRRQVCIVERLEHLFLRSVGGLDVLERALIFMSRTDGQVFWLGTMVESGWHFVERTAPQITGLADAVALPPLSRDEVEAVLLRRHQRSGLPLRFADPAEPSALLARRLNKARTPDERQAVLRNEFFDGLYRASGPHPMLALLYWLRAADFESDADTLTLRPVHPLDFTFVAQFDLPRSFVLKALLQHGSLTLAEHDRIFRTTRQESFLLFESLQNLRLIQRADAYESSATPGRNGRAPEPISEEARYRLHPLAVAPVADALRAKNIL